jgi:hypothetical protein
MTVWDAGSYSDWLGAFLQQVVLAVAAGTGAGIAAAVLALFGRR